MRPGAIEFTVTPSGPSSRASVLAQPMTPGRTAFESARLSIGSRTELEVMLMMRPAPLAGGWGRRVLVRPIAEWRRSSTASWGARWSIPTAFVRGGPPPLFTRMSTPPKAASVRSTSRSRSLGSVMSPRTESAPSWSASRSSSSWRRANIATFAPSAANARAIASPIPEDAPQTIAVRPFRPRSTASGGEDADDLADGVGRLVQEPLLLLGEIELDDLLDSTGPHLDRHAHVEILDAVFALEIGRAGEDPLLVEHDRIDYLSRGRTGCVPRRGAEQLHELAPARGGPGNELPDPFLRHELPQRDSSDGRRRDDRDHLIAVAAQHHCSHVLHRGAGLPRDEGGEPRRIEDACHSEHAVLGPARDVLRDVAHGVERVRDDDQDRVGGSLRHLLRHGAHDLLVRGDEIVAAHVAGPRHSCGDDDHVRAGADVVFGRALDARLVAEDGAGLVDVERLSGREALLDVHERHIAVVPAGGLLD